MSVLVWFDEKAIFFITLCVLPHPYFLYISLCLIKLCDLYFIHILSVLLKYLNTQKYYSIYFYLRNLWNLCISVNASINKLENTLNPYRCHGYQQCKGFKLAWLSYEVNLNMSAKFHQNQTTLHGAPSAWFSHRCPFNVYFRGHINTLPVS